MCPDLCKAEWNLRKTWGETRHSCTEGVAVSAVVQETVHVHKEVLDERDVQAGGLDDG